MFDRTRIWLCAVAAALTLPAQEAAAQKAPVVVELYTSQGCSSCPPADELLGELARTDDVIALSLHVDYWDYLGWRDIFATEENTLRQLGYRESSNARSVYTPQIIVNGVDRVVGSNRKEVLASIERHSGMPPHAEVALKVVDGMLEARITPSRPVSRPCTVWAVAYHTPKPVKIKHGENQGRVIAYSNVAKGFMRLGAWKGGKEVVVTAPIPMGAAGMAVILQEGDFGPIVGAAQIDLSPGG